MLHLLDAYVGGAPAQQVLAGLLDHVRQVQAQKGRGDAGLLARAEAEVQADPSRCIRFDETGDATVYAAGGGFQAGRFAVPALCTLRDRALRAWVGAGRPRARARLFILDGASPATDIGALQATAPPRSLFQVASQFNCLESPGRYVTPVADYVHDPTQGPRASVSAFPGTLVRHYAAPDPAAAGGRFVQTTEGRQLNLLGEVCEPDLAQVRCGYLRADDVRDPRALAQALVDRFELIRVGVHDGIEVVLGYDWDGAVAGAPHRTVAQVCTSTVAGGMYGGLPEDDPGFPVICRQLQRAAYLGTLLAAAALGKDRVVLTLIGGGVFGNPLPLIWDAILWAVDQVAGALHRDLLVVVNGRNLGQEVPPAQLEAAAAGRGGAVIRFTQGGPVVGALA